MPSDLCVFSCDYGLDSQEMLRLLLSCRKVGVDIKVYGQGKWPGWAVAKISHALDFIRRHDHPYFLFTDGYDSFLTRGEDAIIEAYRKIGSPIVISAEKNCWPDDGIARLYPDSPSPWKYICAGGWIGERYALIDLLERLEGNRFYNTQNDQSCWSDYYLSPEADSMIELDWGCEIFQTMYLTADEEISPEGRNLVTGSYPCIFHFNGNKLRLNDYYQRLTGIPILSA